MRGYYGILGVRTGCSAAEIKAAYRARAKECHPDVCDDPDAEERFRQVHQAYYVLRDPELRQTYDRTAAAWPAHRDWHVVTFRGHEEALRADLEREAAIFSAEIAEEVSKHAQSIAEEVLRFREEINSVFGL